MNIIDTWPYRHRLTADNSINIYRNRYYAIRCFEQNGTIQTIGVRAKDDDDARENLCFISLDVEMLINFQRGCGSICTATAFQDTW